MGRNRHRDGVLLALLSVGWLAMIAGCDDAPVPPPAQTQFDSPTMEIPLELVHGIPAIRQDGRVAGNSLLLIDTGCAVTVFSRRCGGALSIVADRSLEIEFLDAFGNGGLLGRMRRVEEYRLGSVSFRSFDVLVDDLGSMRCTFGEDFGGLLGAALFADCLLTIDYPARTLRLEHRNLGEADGREILPLRRGRDGALLVPLRLSRGATWARLDTGDSSSLCVPEDLARQVGLAGGPVQTELWTSAASERRVRMARLAEDVQLGTHRLRRPIVQLCPEGQRASIGSGLLRHFAVSIDQQQGSVRLHRTSREPIDTPGLRALGFTVDRRDDQVMVADVIPGSEAAFAGVRFGDRLLSVNGTSARNFTPAMQRQLQEQCQAMEIDLLRCGQRLRLTVPVTVLIP